MTNLAPAFGVAYAGAVSSLLPLIEDDVRQPLMLGSMGWAGAGTFASARVGGWIGGDLSPAGLESPDEPHAESGRAGGAH